MVFAVDKIHVCKEVHTTGAGCSCLCLENVCYFQETKDRSAHPDQRSAMNSPEERHIVGPLVHSSFEMII